MRAKRFCTDPITTGPVNTRNYFFFFNDYLISNFFFLIMITIKIAHHSIINMKDRNNCTFLVQ